MPHYVKPVIDGDWIGLEFRCDEPEGSICRITCPPEHGCEVFTMEMVDGEPWHTGYSYDDETDEESDGYLHKMIPRETCGILEWDALNETYAGEKTVLHEGEVVFKWEHDYYSWTYAPVEEVTP
jgi:hypothetical protein